MPVTYLILTPLAFFTLDTGTWETRGHSVARIAVPPAAPAVVARAPEPPPVRHRAPVEATVPIGKSAA
jgi:hypothetical protein